MNSLISDQQLICQLVYWQWMGLSSCGSCCFLSRWFKLWHIFDHSSHIQWPRSSCHLCSVWLAWRSHCLLPPSLSWSLTTICSSLVSVRSSRSPTVSPGEYKWSEKIKDSIVILLIALLCIPFASHHTRLPPDFHHSPLSLSLALSLFLSLSHSHSFCNISWSTRIQNFYTSADEANCDSGAQNLMQLPDAIQPSD